MDILMRTRGELNLLLRPICVALVLVLACGCSSMDDWSFTARLWTGPTFTKRNAPTLLPHLELFADEAHSDVLVVYDEAIDGGSRIRRRAFFVNQNLDRITARKKPDFVSPEIGRDLQPIPILAAGSEKDLPAHGLAVIENKEDKQLTLYSEGEKLVTVTLPSYFSGGKFGKAMLTPLAVTGDALMIATVVGVIVAIAYAKGHSSGD